VPSFDDAALERLRAILARRPAIEIEAPQHRRAAVLMPLVRDGDRWSLLLSRRSANLAAHSGQIAFPGGSVDAGETPEDAAVREADEEVGIRSDAVELIGRLDDVISNTGFLVAPFVGVVNGPIEYVLHRAEVDEVFEVPIEAMLVPEQPEVRYVPFRGREYPAYFYQYQGYEIWGVTGRMLKSLLDLVWMAL